MCARGLGDHVKRPPRVGQTGKKSWPYVVLGPRGLSWVRWNNIPYHDRQVVLMTTPKAANSSVKFALLNAGDRKVEDGEHRLTEHWSPAQVAASGYRAIAIARNPFARAVSVWHSKVAKPGKSGLTRYRGISAGQGFLEFLRAVQPISKYGEQHVRPQFVGMMHRGRFLPEQIVKVEDPGGWQSIRDLYPELPMLPQRNVSGAPDWRELCHGEARDLILRRWSRDFEMFGYDTDPGGEIKSDGGPTVVS